MLLSKEGIISMPHRQLNWKAQSQTGNIAIILVPRRLFCFGKSIALTFQQCDDFIAEEIEYQAEGDNHQTDKFNKVYFTHRHTD